MLRLIENFDSIRLKNRKSNQNCLRRIEVFDTDTIIFKFFSLSSGRAEDRILRFGDRNSGRLLSEITAAHNTVHWPAPTAVGVGTFHWPAPTAVGVGTFHWPAPTAVGVGTLSTRIWRVTYLRVSNFQPNRFKHLNKIENRSQARIESKIDFKRPNRIENRFQVFESNRESRPSVGIESRIDLEHPNLDLNIGIF